MTSLLVSPIVPRNRTDAARFPHWISVSAMLAAAILTASALLKPVALSESVSLSFTSARSTPSS